MKIVVSGSSGLIGSHLLDALRRQGHDVVPLLRRRPAAGEHALVWDPERGTIDRAGLEEEGADALIHLAGENVFGRWTPTKQQRIRDSRVMGTRLLAEALARLSRRPAVLLAASARIVLDKLRTSLSDLRAGDGRHATPAIGGVTFLNPPQAVEEIVRATDERIAEARSTGAPSHVTWNAAPPPGTPGHSARRSSRRRGRAGARARASAAAP